MDHSGAQALVPFLFGFVSPPWVLGLWASDLASGGWLEVGHPEKGSDFSQGSSAVELSLSGWEWKALCQQLGQQVLP